MARPALPHGADYVLYVDGDGPFPDPRTLRQPAGVEGPSRAYDHAQFTWGDQDWRGRDLRGAVIYELHIGTFTPDGTFTSAIAKLDHLIDLGVDFIEIMPVAPVPGVRNWGYDGVDLWAVREDYGGPDGLKTLVDACHRNGIGVILDVVYNHLGPSGNYLNKFGPYLHDFKGSFWGDAVNLDGRHSDEVRRYFIENALQWLRDYHIDGLRLDAVHALHDKRAVHFLEELAGEVEVLSAVQGRPLTLIAESDLNDPGLITRFGLHATWNDDVHHAIHSNVTGETHAYYADFGGPASLAKVLTSALLPRRQLLVVPGPLARPAGDRAAGVAVRGVGAEPRPDRQPPGRRPDDRRPALGRLGASVDLALYSDALHGRGMGRLDAVLFLHRPFRPGPFQQ